MIRTSTEADAAAIARVQVETWRAAYAGVMPPDFLAGLTQDMRYRQWTQALARNPRDLWVAEDAQVVVGFGFSLLVREGEAAVTGEVFALYVLPEFQGRGHGQGIMRAIEDDCRRRGASQAVLRVLEANRPARRFYERGGYRQIGDPATETFGSATLGVLRFRKAL